MTVLPLLMAVTLTSAPAPTLTMAQVLRATTAHHPALVAARYDVDAARGGLRAATGAFDARVRAAAGVAPIGTYQRAVGQVAVEQPTPWWGASVAGGYRYGADFPGYKGEYSTPTLGELHLGVRVPLLRGRAIDSARFGLRRGRTGVGIAVQQRDDIARRITQVAGEAWIDWVAAGARLTVAQAQLRLAHARATALQGRVARGATPAFALTENQLSLLARQAKVTAARQKLAQAAVALGLYARDRAGKPAPPPAARLPRRLRVRAALPRARLEPILAGLSARRPDLRVRLAHIALAKSNLQLLGQALLPKLELSVEATQGIGDSAPWLPGQVTKPETTAAAKLSFSLPLQRRQATGKLAVAASKLRAARARLRLAEDKARTDALKAYIAWQGLSRQHRQNVAALTAARAVAEGERRKWHLGRSDLFRVQKREQGVAKAALAEIDVAAAWHRARLAFLVATALPVDGR